MCGMRIGAAALWCAAAGLALAAAIEEIKVELKDGKFTGAKDDLVKFDESSGKVCMYSAGKAEYTVKIPADGDYPLQLEMSCDQAKNVNAQIKLTAGDKVVKEKFLLTQPEPKEYEFAAALKKGDMKIVVEYTNDEYKEGEFDRNFYLHAMKLNLKK